MERCGRACRHARTTSCGEQPVPRWVREACRESTRAPPTRRSEDRANGAPCYLFNFLFFFTNCVFSHELASYTNCTRVKAALRILRGASTRHVSLGLCWRYFRLKFDQVTNPGCHSRRASCCYYCGGCYLFVLYRKARALSLLLVTGFCIFSSIYRVTV